MVYILHGADGLGRDEMIADLRARLVAADPMAALNDIELDGRKLGLAELKTAAETLPFVGDRRLVVVRGLLGRCNPRGGDGQGGRGLADALVAWLPTLPESTRLILADDVLHANNPVLRWAGARKPKVASAAEAEVVVRAFEAPRANALPGWLAARAAARGGSLEPAAAGALAAALEREDRVDLRLADSELQKLLIYAGERPIRADDVAQLVSTVSAQRIFALIDALAERRGAAASTLLHQLLDQNEPPLRILALVARQFRLLLLARHHIDHGVPPGDLAGRLGVAPFVARKLAAQCRRFPPEFLESTLGRIMRDDTDIKTGRMDGVLALDVFVADTCRPPASR